MHLAILGNISLQSVSWHVVFYQTARKSFPPVKDYWWKPSYYYYYYFVLIHGNSEVEPLKKSRHGKILRIKRRNKAMIGTMRHFVEICCTLPTIDGALERGEQEHWGRPRGGMSILHLLSPQTHTLYWDNGKEMVSWPTEEQKWRFAIDGKGTVITIRKRRSASRFSPIGPKSWVIDKLSVFIWFYFPLGQ